MAAVCSGRPAMVWLGALVEHDDGDVGEALALLLPQRGIGQRQQQRGQRQRAQQRAAAAPDQQQRHQHDRQHRAHPEHGGRHHRREVDRPVAHCHSCSPSPRDVGEQGSRGERASGGRNAVASVAPHPDPLPMPKKHGERGFILSEPLQQGRHVHLVGLVVAGQRVHDDVDAGAEGHLALALAARHDRIERLVAVIERPGGGEVVRRDQDRADAVDAPGLSALVAVARRLGLDPQLAAVPAAGEASAAGRTTWSARGARAPAPGAGCRGCRAGAAAACRLRRARRSRPGMPWP